MLNQVRAALIAVHLYGGIALCLLFVLWFVSGVGMAYYRTPVVTETTRLAFAESVIGNQVALPPAALPALVADWNHVDTLRRAQWRGRPLYRWRSISSGWHSAWADSGGAVRFDAVTLEAEARRWLESQQVRYLGVYESDHQWSYFSGARSHYPLHKFATGGWASREVLLSSRTGEVIVATTLGSRLLYYLGPGIHYFSFYPIRNNDALWRALVNWSSGLGVVVCLFGLILGLWRLRWAAVGTERRLIPYTGFRMYWHHWLGLAFGLLTFTFVLSGLFSMNPAQMFPTTSVPDALREEYFGPRPPIGSVPALNFSSATPLLGSSVRELEYRRLRGRQMMLAVSSQQNQRLFEWQDPEWRSRAAFGAAELMGLLQPVLSAPIADVEWLASFDSHYYARKERYQPLPALRVRLDDSHATWLYLEPASGALFLKSDVGTRARRWLYNGLHSFDFRLFLERERLWLAVIWVLSLGGLLLSLGSVAVSWQWLTRWRARRRRKDTPSRTHSALSSGDDPHGS